MYSIFPCFVWWFLIILMGSTFGLIAQIVSIIFAVYAIVAPCVTWGTQEFTYRLFISGFFPLVIGIILIMTEVYSFELFKYFSFIFTTWGKALFYLLLGFIFWAQPIFNTVSSIIFLVFAVVETVFFFVGLDRTNAPLFSKNLQFNQNTSDYIQQQA